MSQPSCRNPTNWACLRMRGRATFVDPYRRRPWWAQTTLDGPTADVSSKQTADATLRLGARTGHGGEVPQGRA